MSVQVKLVLILSCYGGPGNTGIRSFQDTIVTWESSLSTYFTSTASNIHAQWWSHDIGGHMRELLRWRLGSSLVLGSLARSIVSIVLMWQGVVYSSETCRWMSDIYAYVTAYYISLHHECGDAWTRTCLGSALYYHYPSRRRCLWSEESIFLWQ